MKPVSWKIRAHNSASESENRIHSDDVARQYGFRGGLVPGVTVHAYLSHPAVEAWGEKWLTRGTAELTLARPVYHGDEVRVELEEVAEESYSAVVLDPEGTRCATATVALGSPQPPPRRRSDPPCAPPESRPPATREVLEKLRENGMGALHLRWEPEGISGSYTGDPSEMSQPFRPDGGRLANPSFTLGLANWILSRNVRLGPWIHVASRVRHFEAIADGAELLVQSRVLDVFERGGHEFVDLEVDAFIQGSGATLSAWHRAIYRPRTVSDERSPSSPRAPS